MIDEADAQFVGREADAKGRRQGGGATGRWGEWGGRRKGSGGEMLRSFWACRLIGCVERFCLARRDGRHGYGVDANR